MNNENLFAELIDPKQNDSDEEENYGKKYSIS